MGRVRLRRRVGAVCSAAARCRRGYFALPASGCRCTRIPLARPHLPQAGARHRAGRAGTGAGRGIYSRRLRWSAHRRRPFPRGSADTASRRAQRLRRAQLGTKTRISRNPSSRSSTSAAAGLRLYMSSAFTSAPSAPATRRRSVSICSMACILRPGPRHGPQTKTTTSGRHGYKEQAAWNLRGSGAVPL